MSLVTPLGKRKLARAPPGVGGSRGGAHRIVSVPTASHAQAALERLESIRKEIAKVIVGQQDIVDGVLVCLIAKQIPSGTTICEMIEMYIGLFVSPVPCNPPVYASATVISRPDTLNTRSSC